MANNVPLPLRPRYCKAKRRSPCGVGISSLVPRGLRAPAVSLAGQVACVARSRLVVISRREAHAAQAEELATLAGAAGGARR